VADYALAGSRRATPPESRLTPKVNVSLPSKVDAAFNILSSFQLLPTERAAEGHLRTMASNIAKGGLYILGLHLMPSRGALIKRERNVATRGRLSVVCRLWTKEIYSKQRHVRCGMITEIKTNRKRVRIVEECGFRTYSADQIQRLFDGVGLFEPVATYDYSYNLANPISVGPETQDVVYVLRRR
jgi:hypothetical protein